jgi:polyisoprenoid-binding protein YceI
MKRCLVAAALVVSFAGAAMAAGSKWDVDPKNSAVQFQVRHLGISNVQGAFTTISGTVMLDDADISKSSVSASIDMSSVDTRVSARDSDLKSDKFFNVAQFPTMTFQSTKIWSTGRGSAKMEGNLTLHGVTKDVVFDVSGPTPAINQNGTMRRGAEATAKIERSDFGITADPGIVGEEVSITLDIELTQAGAGGTPAPVAPGSRASQAAAPGH